MDLGEKTCICPEAWALGRGLPESMFPHGECCLWTRGCHVSPRTVTGLSPLLSTGFSDSVAVRWAEELGNAHVPSSVTVPSLLSPLLTVWLSPNFLGALVPCVKLHS